MRSRGDVFPRLRLQVLWQQLAGYPDPQPRAVISHPPFFFPRVTYDTRGIHRPAWLRCLRRLVALNANSNLSRLPTTKGLADKY